MKEFRDELLELLHTNVGEFIEITPLVVKYCGASNEFNNGDKIIINCRLNINNYLQELKEMGWINVTGILSTSHMMNHRTGKREFTIDYPVKARITTKGELEYKALTNQAKQVVTNIQNIGANSGVIIQGTNSSDLVSLPITNTTITSKKNAKSSIEEISLWRKLKREFWKVIIGVIIIVIAAYIVWELGWR